MADVISSKDQIQHLIQTYRTKEPRLADILDTMAKDLHNVIVAVSPIRSQFDRDAAVSSAPPSEVVVVIVTLLPLNILINWNAVIDAAQYEIREGVDWDTGLFIVKTASLSAVLFPRLVGTYFMQIKSISSAGVYSIGATNFQFTIPAMGSMTLTILTIDNNVLLSWTIPTSAFQIHHYNVYREGVKFAEITGTFLSRFEAAAGTFLFGVEAVDVAGNVSPQATGSATVTTPPDYILEDTRTVDLSTVSTVNCLFDDGGIVACLDLTETYENHFINGGAVGGADPWDTPQEQVDETYERWIQNNLLTGSFQDEHDYGTILTNTVATINYVKTGFSGTSDVAEHIELSWSDDGVVWSPFSAGAAQFIPSLRFLRTKMVFNAPNDDAMIKITSFVINLSVKREVDGNSIFCFASDVNGTEVLIPGDFSIGHGSKTFKDVDSITVAPASTSPYTAIFDFVDIPNPVHFFIFVFDSAGRRIDGLVDWKIKGIT